MLLILTKTEALTIQTQQLLNQLKDYWDLSLQDLAVLRLRYLRICTHKIFSETLLEKIRYVHR